MNFNDLLTKMKQIDEGTVEECMPIEIGHAPQQSDSVTMNVSMNGSGAGGIRDLLNVLKDIQDGPEAHAEPQHGHDAEHDVLVGDGYDNTDGGFESATTKPNEVTLDIDAVTPTGNDMHSKGKEAEKVNGGGNPFNVDESLVSRLSEMYNEVKSR